MRSLWGAVQKLAEKTGIVESQDVVDMRGNWLSVHKYYSEVQKASDDNHLERLRLQLPEVESQLDRMIDLLKKERKEFVVSVATNPNAMDGEADLPPCYSFLLKGSGNPTSPQQGGGSGHADPEALPAGSTIVAPGHGDVVMCVCQFAKHDQPRGTRPVMLRFLSKLFGELDANANEATTSILNFSTDFVAMPVADMLHKVSTALHPWTHSATSTTSSEERYELIRFASILCQKIMQQPSLAQYFLVDMSHAHHTTPTPSPSVTPSKKPQHSGGGLSGSTESPLLVLSTLVPYIKDQLSDSTLSDSTRLDAIREALRGIVCVAKCHDKKISDMVANCGDIGELAAGEICRTLLTVCKAPSNPFFRFQFDYIQEVLCFMDELLTLTPHVALKLRIEHFLCEKIVKDTLMKLLIADKDQVFVSVALVVSSVLRRLSGEDTRLMVGELLLNNTELRSGLIKRIGSQSDDECHAALLLLTSFFDCLPSLAMSYLLDHDLAALTLKIEKNLEVPKINEVKPGAAKPHHQSNAAPLPQLDVSTLFPKRLRVDYLCGTNSTHFNVEVRQSLLRVESNLFSDDYKTLVRKKHLTYHKRHREDSEVAQCRTYYAGVAQCELVKELVSQLKYGLLERTFAIASAFSSLIFTICVLPDSGIGYTLLHDSNSFGGKYPDGPIRSVLETIKKHIDFCLDQDDKQLAEQDQAPPAKMDDPDVPTPLRAKETRLSIYNHCVNRPFFEVEEQDIDGADGPFKTAMRAHRGFVNGCIAVEGMRHELSTLFAIVEMDEQFDKMTSDNVGRPGLQ